jgi:hypothetical protein
MEKRLTEDEWLEKYTPIDNPFTEQGSYDNTLYETYGDEYEAIKIADVVNPRKVWTLIDNNEGWTGIVAGWHYVNRMGYFLTEEEWEDDQEEYTVYDESEEQELKEN